MLKWTPPELSYEIILINMENMLRLGGIACIQTASQTAKALSGI